ncbi:MAG: ribosome small subunit-dependent GTPase A [Phototrophicaceae bacterium]
MSNQLSGLVIKNQSGFYWVETTDGTVYICRLRGRLKEDAQASNIAAIGDSVVITPHQNEDGIDELRGIIEDVHDRHTVISRAVRTTGKRGAGQAEREHVLIANPDQALFVFSAAQPTPNWKLLDRLLVTAESNYLDNIIIVINKVDAAEPHQLDNLLKPYRTMGYEIMFTSALTGVGIEALKAKLTDKISVLTGPSGVGKTSLLNEIQPDLGRVTNSISEYSQEGMHTTRDSALIKLDFGGYLADTPGIRQMNVWDVEPDELDAYFLDISAYVTQCKFRNCSHEQEPGCAVRAAIATGDISQRRYENYIELRDELKDTYIIY